MKIKLLEPIEGYEEIAEFKVCEPGDICVGLDGFEYHSDDSHLTIVLKPIKKVLDWGKVDGNVLVSVSNVSRRFADVGVFTKIDRFDQFWQAHTLGHKCPVDTNACIVQIKYWCSHDSEYILSEKLIAKEINWGVACQFRIIGLADGYEYP